ncbi:hypothetical protein P3X46_013182 [Hevea brasiliensis]|uniref:Tf2-1-like SH3-like domain-containing protein n=1 Tax=Hevea brasiliensis TaxID=3981 RepID=A0ABQ9M6L2_HEVBR|nr:hypothetical protein P3X46_013182 [Hevea brasiliensis]
MAFFACISTSTLSIPTPIRRPIMISRRLLCPLATLSSSSPESASASASTRTHDSSKTPSTPFVESSRPHDSSFNYARANPTGSSPFVRFVRSTESDIERVIFDFRFLALLAIGGSLAGSLLCFLNGCVYIFDAYKVYWTSCVKGIHSGQMVLRLVKAIGKKGKLSPRFIGPYDVIERVGPVAYKLASPPELDKIHSVFHLSMLRRYRSDPSHVILAEEIIMQPDLIYEKEPVRILAREVKELRNKRIPLVKVLWRHHNTEEATWESEKTIR